MDMNNVFAGVNWQDVQPAAAGREVWEPGWTQCVIADSKGAENGNKNGFGLTLYLKAVSGPNTGKTIDDFINVFHEKPQAQEIGQRQFSAYCHATGEFKPVDNHASNLRNKPFWVKTEVVEEEYTPNGKTEVVKTRKSKVKDWDSNNGTKHGTGNGNGAATPTASPPPANAAPAATPAPSPSEQPKAEWASPPPGAGAAPAGGAPWGAGGGTAAPANAGGAAPWNS
jgi:hypothetical protein